MSLDMTKDKKIYSRMASKSLDEDTIYLHKRDKKICSMTYYCQVDKDGTVNGVYES